MNVSRKIEELLGDSSTSGIIVDDLNHLRSLRHFIYIENFQAIALKTQVKEQTTQSERHEIEKILRKEIGIILKQSRDISFSELDQIKKNILNSNISIDEISSEFQAQLSKIQIKYRT